MRHVLKTYGFQLLEQDKQRKAKASVKPDGLDDETTHVVVSKPVAKPVSKPDGLKKKVAKMSTRGKPVGSPPKKVATVSVQLDTPPTSVRPIKTASRRQPQSMLPIQLPDNNWAAQMFDDHQQIPATPASPVVPAYDPEGIMAFMQERTLELFGPGGTMADYRIPKISSAQGKPDVSASSSSRRKQGQAPKSMLQTEGINPATSIQFVEQLSQLRK